MSAAFIGAWTGLGTVTGAAFALGYRRLPATVLSAPCVLRLVDTLLTALAFGGFAWRFGYQFDLLPYSVLAAFGVALAMIDVIEQRLPSMFVFSGAALIGALLATSAILYAKGPDFLRALVGMAAVAVFYLVLALVSGGGLGAGDVKLGGLLGLALGWLSWSVLITATFVAWLAAALAWLLLRVAGRKPRGSVLPMGPFLVLGALLTIGVLPV